MRSIEKGHREFETEYRDIATRYNECIMTAIRTMWGVSMQYVKQTFGTDLWQYCMDMALPYLKSGKLKLKDDYLYLTRKGIFISDGIISDLMFVEE